MGIPIVVKWRLCNDTAPGDRTNFDARQLVQWYQATLKNIFSDRREWGNCDEYIYVYIYMYTFIYFKITVALATHATSVNWLSWCLGTDYTTKIGCLFYIEAADRCKSSRYIVYSRYISIEILMHLSWRVYRSKICINHMSLLGSKSREIWEPLPHGLPLPSHKEYSHPTPQHLLHHLTLDKMAAILAAVIFKCIFLN